MLRDVPPGCTTLRRGRLVATEVQHTVTFDSYLPQGHAKQNRRAVMLQTITSDGQRSIQFKDPEREQIERRRVDQRPRGDPRGPEPIRLRHSQVDSRRWKNVR
jgi:hypothetical protein